MYGRQCNFFSSLSGYTPLGRSPEISFLDKRGRLNTSLFQHLEILQRNIQDLTHIETNIYIYTYVYMFLALCVCETDREKTAKQSLVPKLEHSQRHLSQICRRHGFRFFSMSSISSMQTMIRKTEFSSWSNQQASTLLSCTPAHHGDT